MKLPRKAIVVLRSLDHVELARVVGGQHVDNPGQTPMKDAKIKDPEQR